MPPDSGSPTTQPPEGSSRSHGTRVATNSLANMAGRMGSMVFWMLVTPAILHSLGPERFGLWSLMFVFTTYMLVMDFGVGNALSRFSADLLAREERGRLEAYVATATTFYAGLSVVFVLLALGLARPVLAALRVPDSISDARPALFICALTAGATGFASVLNGVLIGMQRLVVVNIINLSALLPGALGIWLVLRGGGGLRGILVVQTGMATLMALGAAFALSRDRGGFRLRGFGWDAQAARALFQLGVWIQMTAMLVLVQFQADKVLLAHWVNLGTVGAYELGFRVANGVFAVPILAFGAVAPAAAELAARGETERLRALHVRGMRWVSALTLPLAVGTCAGGAWLMRGWLNRAPEGATLTLTALSLAWALNALTGTGTSILQGEGRPQLTFGCMAVAVALHLGLSCVLIPRYGLPGSLLALLISMAVWAALFLALFHRRRGWSAARCTLPPLARPLAVSLVLAAGTVALLRVLPEPAHMGRVTALLLGLALTGAPAAVGVPVLVALRHFEPADLEVFRSILRRLRLRGGRPEAPPGAP